MTRVEDRMTEIEKKQSFWKGFLTGIATTIGCIAGLLTAGYYFLGIVRLLSDR